MLFRSFLLAALFTSGFATGSINPDPQTIQSISARTAEAEVASSNSKRLAMGHPPLRIRYWNQLRNRDTKTTASSSGKQRKPSPGPPPPPNSIRLNGHLGVKNCTTRGKIGYVSKVLNPFGEYVITQNLSNALSVTFDAPFSGKAFDIIAQNQAEPFASFGGIAGFASSSDDLKVGSSNYAFLGGVNAHTPPDSPPVAGGNSFTSHTSITKKVETAIWKFRSASSQLIPQWVNTDRSKPTTKLVHFGPENLLALTSDLKKFEEDFGSPSTTVELFLIRA